MISFHVSWVRTGLRRSGLRLPDQASNWIYSPTALRIFVIIIMTMTDCNDHRWWRPLSLRCGNQSLTDFPQRCRDSRMRICETKAADDFVKNPHMPFQHRLSVLALRWRWLTSWEESTTIPVCSRDRLCNVGITKWFDLWQQSSMQTKIKRSKIKR